MKPTKANNDQASEAEIVLEAAAKLAGLRILIIEDVGMIAMELRLMLEHLNCRIAGVASRLHEATMLAQTTEHLDGVLLDLNLSGENSYPIGDILRKRGIPFIIMSGYDASHIRADFANDAHVQKPFTHHALARMMLRTFLPAKDA